MMPIRILAVALLAAAALALEAAFLVGVVAAPLAAALHQLAPAATQPVEPVDPAAAQPPREPVRVAGQGPVVPVAGGPRAAGRRAVETGR